MCAGGEVGHYQVQYIVRRTDERVEPTSFHPKGGHLFRSHVRHASNWVRRCRKNALETAGARASPQACHGPHMHAMVLECNGPHMPRPSYATCMHAMVLKFNGHHMPWPSYVICHATCQVHVPSYVICMPQFSFSDFSRCPIAS